MENNLILSNFWTRVWAILIDTLLLGLFGFLLGLLFKEQFIKLGNLGPIIGWIISLAYFSILNSKINNGQTLGKKILNIQVVNIKGENISLTHSFLRSLVLVTPFFLNGFKIPGVKLLSAITVVQSIIIFTFLIGGILFYILNKETRQAIHDLIMKTYVVMDYRDEEVSVMPNVSKLPFYILGGIALIVSGFAIFNLTNSNSTIGKLVPVYEKISALENVNNALVKMQFNPLVDSLGNERFVYTVEILTSEKTNNPDGKEMELNNSTKEAVKTFIESNVYASDKDILNIVTTTGYNIGIAKMNKSFNIYKPIEEWKKEIN